MQGILVDNAAAAVVVAVAIVVAVDDGVAARVAGDSGKSRRGETALAN